MSSEQNSDQIEKGSETIIDDVILVLNIEIGFFIRLILILGDSIQEIKVRHNDDPHKIAKEFCVKNNLELDTVDKIAAYIINNLPNENMPNTTPEHSYLRNHRANSYKRVSSKNLNEENILENARKNAYDTQSKYDCIFLYFYFYKAPSKSKHNYVNSLYNEIVYGKPYF